MTGSNDCASLNQDNEIPASKFQPTDRSRSPTLLSLPDELWVTVLQSPCTFPSETFTDVMLNLVKNPNVTSSHLFRADIFYDSDKDPSTSQDEAGNITEGILVKSLKATSRPVRATIPGYLLVRTIVRELIPRNPQLDRPLIQTCHFFQRHMGHSDEDENIVLYIPHVEEASEMPFYHPKVQRLAFHHRCQHAGGAPDAVSTVSISFRLFPEESMSTKLSRTALKLLQTVHKHGQGRLAGYEKKVHLDQMIPQKRYQDTYTRLKATYGKKLASEWVEVTDPGKHVFEDLGIAAFLIELWRDTYNPPNNPGHDPARADFPGFVDIGCGNGLLTYLLLSEGFSGWGFDARQRKSWLTFPENVQACLQRRFLVPDLSSNSERMESTTQDEGQVDDHQQQDNSLQHNGIFTPRTFIISNHADELTAWTPLLAYLNGSAFIAIPCCSHDLAGARFRAPALAKVSRKQKGYVQANGPNVLNEVEKLHESPASPHEDTASRTGIPMPLQSIDSADGAAPSDLRSTQASETGSLKNLRAAPVGDQQQDCDAKQRTGAKGGTNGNSNGSKMPSAYSTLCSYVENLATELGFVAEKDMLRIPSTRNACIIGRKIHQQQPGASRSGEESNRKDVLADTAGGNLGLSTGDEVSSLEDRKTRVREVVEMEMGKTWDEVIGDWSESVERLGRKPGSGH